MIEGRALLYQIEEPKAEPVTLEEAKNHLRLSKDYTDDDDLIRTLIQMARLDAEAKTGGRVFPERQYEWKPGERLIAGVSYEIPVAPATGIKIYNLDESPDTETGEYPEFPVSNYQFIKSSMAPEGSPLYGQLTVNGDVVTPENARIVVTAGWPNKTISKQAVYTSTPVFEPDYTTYTENSITIQFDREVKGELTNRSFNITVDGNYATVIDTDIKNGRVTVKLQETLEAGQSPVFSYVSGFLKDKDANYVMPIMMESLPVVAFDREQHEVPQPETVEELISECPGLLKTWMLVRITTLYQQRSEIAIQAGKTSNAFFPRDFINGMLDAYRVLKA